MARIWTGPIESALVLESPAVELDGLLAAQGVRVTRLKAIPNEDELIAELQRSGAQAVFKRSKVEITRRVVEACPSLLVVQLCCIGDDSVDKVACADHGVMVFNDPVSNGRSVVELVVGNLIALARRLYTTNDECRQGGWDKSHHERYEVLGKRLGVVGLGNIGRGVARAAAGLGMRVHFFDTRQVSVELGKELGWTPHDSLDSLFRACECVTVHLSARDVQGVSNEGLITERHLMQLGAECPEGMRVFVNFARGFVHSPEALLAAVRAGAVKGAAVDVYPDEPRQQGGWVNPYREEPRVAVFPHIGASTQEAQPRIARRVAETFGEFSALGAVRDTPFSARVQLSLSAQARAGQALLMVCHSTARGTKRAIDEAIYEAGVSNIASAHVDFDEFGVAYDLALMDGALSRAQVADLIERAGRLTRQEGAIRSIRQVVVGVQG